MSIFSVFIIGLIKKKGFFYDNHRKILFSFKFYSNKELTEAFS